jgi:hypothetical protein
MRWYSFVLQFTSWLAHPSWIVELDSDYSWTGSSNFLHPGLLCGESFLAFAGMVNIFRFHIRVTVGRVGIDCIGYLTMHAMKLSQNQLIRVIAIVYELLVKFRLYYTVPHITSNSMMCHHSGAVDGPGLLGVSSTRLPQMGA